MTQFLTINVNMVRNGVRRGDAGFQRSEARKCVKLLLVPRDASMFDRDIPDCLVTDSMIDRFLAIDPPIFRALLEFDLVVDEIERAYVLGMFFSALSASVVSIERLLNKARIGLHKYASPKIKGLWNKDALPVWQPNIDALAQWNYVSPELAEDLSKLYRVRCRYLHSDPVHAIEADCLAAIKAAYRLMDELLGCPPRLFRIGSEIDCLAPNDPLVKVFYVPHMTE